MGVLHMLHTYIQKYKVGHLKTAVDLSLSVILIVCGQ